MAPLTDGIQRFLDQVDPKILARGQDYFRSGRVKRWALENGHVTAEVSGSGLYRVELELSPKGAVSGCFCTCPYNRGPVCKHETAVLLAIQAEPPKNLERREKKRREQAEALRRLVGQAGRDRLAALILERCQKDLPFQTWILSQLEDAGQEEYRALQDLIQESIAVNRDRGIIDAAGCDSICAVLEGSLEKARRRISRGQAAQGLEIARLVLLSGLELAGETDSSSGLLPWTVDDAIETVGLAAAWLTEQGTREQRSGALARILETARSPVFDAWVQWRYQLLNQGVELADQEGEKRFLEVLDRLEKRRHPEEPRYREWAHLLRYQLLRSTRGPAGARPYLEQHLDEDPLCLILALEKLEARDFAAAEQLCLQRLEAVPCDWSGQWRRLLFEIYRDWGKREEQLAQVRELMQTGEEEYGRRLKDLLGGEDPSAQ